MINYKFKIYKQTKKNYSVEAVHCGIVVDLRLQIRNSIAHLGNVADLGTWSGLLVVS